MRSFSACLFSSARRALQCSHQTPRSEPGEEPPPLPEPGEPVPKPGEPPREPGELVPMPGEAGPGEPVKEPGEEVPEPGDGVPEEPRAEPAPSGAGRPPARDSSYAFRYQLSGEKGAAGLVGEQGSVTWSGRRSSGSGKEARRRRQVSLGRSAPAVAPAPRPPPRGAPSRRRPAPRKLRGAGRRSAAAAGREAQEPRHRGDRRSEPLRHRQLTPYFLLRAVTAILSLFPATEFMVASQGGGRISYRSPSPHPKGIAGAGKSTAERAGWLPPPPPTGSLSPKTPVSPRENAWRWGSFLIGFSSLSPLSFPYKPCFHRNGNIQIRSAHPHPRDRQRSSHPQVR